MRKTQISISIVALVIIAIHLGWPAINIDSITLILLIVAIVPWLAQLFKSVEFPGGWKIEFKEFMQAEQRASDAGLLSGQVDPARKYSYQIVADEDANLALAGLRIEIEKRLMRIAHSHNLDGTRSSAGRLLRLLGQKDLLSNQEQAVLSDMMSLLNSAVHGAQIDGRTANWAMDVGPRLLASLDEKVK